MDKIQKPNQQISPWEMLYLPIHPNTIHRIGVGTTIETMIETTKINYKGKLGEKKYIDWVWENNT